MRTLDGARERRGYCGRWRDKERKYDQHWKNCSCDIHGDETSVASPLSVTVAGKLLSVVMEVVHGTAPPVLCFLFGIEGVPGPPRARARHPDTRS